MTTQSPITVVVTFDDGTSLIHTYEHSTRHEAMTHAWNEAHATGKCIWDVRVQGETNDDVRLRAY
jgi:hypothetical protein